MQNNEYMNIPKEKFEFAVYKKQDNTLACKVNVETASKV